MPMRTDQRAAEHRPSLWGWCGGALPLRLCHGGPTEFDRNLKPLKSEERTVGNEFRLRHLASHSLSNRPELTYNNNNYESSTTYYDESPTNDYYCWRSPKPDVGTEILIRPFNQPTCSNSNSHSSRGCSVRYEFNYYFGSLLCARAGWRAEEDEIRCAALCYVWIGWSDGRLPPVTPAISLCVTSLKE
ncbi:unnamed protein product [Calypogeia fissa]